eukprot:CAMPEP_0185381528 /NCGR_PEP_ID=MMETSP1364-20130426/52989_1 /TAXON_ID=38817 /ORGANISM="Gephyrocapsa oceanica, Strain RCC1303" /LENGTH=117 /DNA_ID=CAMNT_0027983187 /DNA_START=292 /DNA_END=644 /DNA_ORIENTATION=-
MPTFTHVCSMLATTSSPSYVAMPKINDGSFSHPTSDSVEQDVPPQPHELSEHRQLRQPHAVPRRPCKSGRLLTGPTAAPGLVGTMHRWGTEELGIVRQQEAVRCHSSSHARGLCLSV